MNSSVLFILIGVAIYLLLAAQRHKWSVIPLSIIVLVISTLSFFENILKCDFGIDELLVKDIYSTSKIDGVPGRMGVTTALCFILFSLYFLSYGLKNRIVLIIRQWILHLVSYISFVAVLGYIFDISSLYKISYYTSMAGHTALLMFILSVILTLLQPNKGLAAIFMGNTSGNNIARRLFGITTVLTVIMGILRIEAHRQGAVGVEFGIALFALSFITINLVAISIVTFKTNELDLKRLNAEHKLEEINKNLERIIEQRTKELKEISDRLVLTTSASVIGTWRIDLSQNQISGNSIFAYLLGIEESELPISNERMEELIHPEDKEYALTQFYLADKQHAPLDFEHRIIQPNGAIKFLKVRGTVIRNEQGESVELLGVHIDITAQKTAEENLRINQANLKSIIDSTSNLIWSLDRKFNYLTANESFKTIVRERTGKDPEVGEHIFQANQHEEVIQKWKGFYERAINGDDFKFQDNLGGKTIEYHFNPIRNDRSEITGVTVTGEDITLRKNQEKELLEKANFIEALRENVPCLIYIFDRENNQMTYMNSYFEETLGFSLNELNELENSIFSLVHPEDLVLYGALKIERDAGNMEKQTTEVRIKNKNNDYIWLSLTDIGLTKIDEYIRETIGIGLEITDRKLTENKLIEDKETAEHLTKIKSEFLSIMSHEIRTPMNAVIGFTELLVKEHPREDQKEYLDIILFSTRHLLGLINDVLDYSKIEAGKINFEKRPFNVIQQLTNLVQLFSDKASEKGITLSLLPVNETHLSVLGDELRFNQIFSNLIGNAVKFTSVGSVSVGVDCLKNEDSTVYLCFSITDSGIGIEADKLEHIFDSFNQADAGTSRNYGGTGLGLAISKQLVELQNGTISVESEVGKGTVFKVMLPFETVDENNSAILNIPISKEKNLEGAHILLVEDNAINVLLARKILTDWNCVITVALNGKEAVDKLNVSKYDLVLMDLNMPVMDGYEATRLIRESLNLSMDELPIIGLSANAESELKNNALEFFNGYVSKPFQADKLYEALIIELNKNGFKGL